MVFIKRKFVFASISLLIVLLLSLSIVAWPSDDGTILSDLASDDMIKVSKTIQKNKLNEKTKVIVQVKNKQVSSKIKKGKIINSSDSSLIFAEAYGNEIVDLAKDSDVIKIWPDLQTQAFLNESVYQINADDLWNLSLNGSGIKIAILDTGVDSSHEMLNGGVILSNDFTGTGSQDVFGHGTHVAGIAAGNGKYKGVAPGALIMNGKVLDNSGYGQLSWLINGIDWAMNPDGNPNTNDGADIISLSLGATYSGTPEEMLDAPEVLKIKEATDKGIVVVIASGNCGPSGNCNGFVGVTTPGITKEAITVGAVSKSNEWAPFSSGGVISDYIKPDVTAPGVNIISSVPSSYAVHSGTSMATPHVAGAVALLLQDNPYLTPAEVKEILENSATDLGEKGKDTKYGSGVINLSDIIRFHKNLPRISDVVVDGSYILDDVTLKINATNTKKVSIAIKGPNNSSYSYDGSSYDGLVNLNYVFIAPHVGKYDVTIYAFNEKGTVSKATSFEIKNYKLIIPDFEVGKSDKISLEYANMDECSTEIQGSISGKGTYNSKYKKEFGNDKKSISVKNNTVNFWDRLIKKCSPKKISVVFSLEELDSGIYKSFTESVPSGKSKQFNISFTPALVGKHLLKVDVSDKDNLLEHMEKPVNTKGQVAGKVDEVQIWLRKQ